MRTTISGRRALFPHFYTQRFHTVILSPRTALLCASTTASRAGPPQTMGSLAQRRGAPHRHVLRSGARAALRARVWVTSLDPPRSCYRRRSSRASWSGRAGGEGAPPRGLPRTRSRALPVTPATTAAAVRTKTRTRTQTAARHFRIKSYEHHAKPHRLQRRSMISKKNLSPL